MAYISLSEKHPGIFSLLKYRKDTAKPLLKLTDILLKGPSTLELWEREAIAAYVSHRNDCNYCTMAHGNAAAQYCGGDSDILEEIKSGFAQAEITPKFKALLHIAEKVRTGGQFVEKEDIKRAGKQGATDMEIHDTVMIAALFCMYNRYVDGLGTWSPEEKEAYNETGQNIMEFGYRMKKDERENEAWFK